MAYRTPSPNEIASRAYASLRTHLPGTDALLRQNNLSVIGKVWGLVLHEVHLRAAWLYRQIFASTADGAHLERHAYEFGIARKGASRAAGSIEGVGAANAVYPAGLRFLFGTIAYMSTAAATAGPVGNVVIPVRAEQAGAAGNRSAGDALELADPASVLTLGSTLTVSSGGIGGGADAEGDESLRARILDRRRRPPMGGAVSDYEQWAREVPGVTAAWAAQAIGGPGHVVVWVLFDGRPNGIPTTADLAAVQAALEARRRIARTVAAVAPTPMPVEVLIDKLSPDTAEVRAQVTGALAATFGPDAAGAVVGSVVGRARPGDKNGETLFSLSWISDAIAGATGEDRHRLLEPSSDIAVGYGQIPVLAGVVFT